MPLLRRGLRPGAEAAGTAVGDRRVQILGADQRIDCLVHIGIRHDDHVVLGAAEALRIGLVSKVVPDAELLDAARAYAARIAANPPQAVRMTKRLLWEARQASLETVLQLSAAMQALAHTTSTSR